MANTVSSRKRRFFAVLETTFGTAVAPGNTNCILMEALDIKPAQPEIPRPDLTGDDGELVGMAGRRSCPWGPGKMSAALSGSAGTKPDGDPLLAAAFGAAGVVSAGVSVSYGLGSALNTVSLYEYVTAPSTGTQRMAISAIVDSWKITIGGEVPEWEFGGEAYWGPDTAQFTDSGMDTLAKGGLSAFPTIPASPTTNGTPPPGFKATVTLDSNAYSNARMVTITFKGNRELPKDCIGGYPGAPASGLYSILADIDIYDDDSSQLTSLKMKALEKTIVSQLVFVVGTIAGNIATYTLKNIMMGTPEYDTSQKRRVVKFNNCRAHDSAVGSADAFALVCT